jgi:hypothetical protein
VKEELWYLFIDGQRDSKTGIVGNFYAYGQHLGDALGKVILASNDQDFKNQNLIEASFLNDFSEIDDNEELIEISEKVFMRQTTYSYPFDDPDRDFVAPTGIVKGIQDGDLEYELIKENFIALDKNEDGIYTFELNVAKPNLIDIFYKSINNLPTVDGLWIYIKNYWDNQQTELWTAKHFNDKQIVIDFLQNHQSDTLENGYLDVVVHSLIGETNLTLDEHKKVKLHTKDEDVFSNFIEQIMELGYEQTKDFYSLANDYHHWHYRPADSLTRTEFLKKLIDNNFELIDKWDEE